MKIIQILPHSLSPHNKTADPRFYEDDWHVKVAKKIKNLSNDYEIECWRPEKNLNKIYVRMGDDGIIYKIFPSKYLFKFEYSPLMLKELRKMMDNHKILLHFHGIFYPNTYYILKSIPAQIPVIAQSHASSPTLIRALFDGTPLTLLEPFESLMQKNYFKKVDQFFCLSEREKEKFSKYGNAIIQPMGIDFNKFKPAGKEMALKSFGLENKKYILYVGRINKIKGVDYLIRGFKDSLIKHELTLIIAGEGPYKPELKSLIKDLKISNYIKFLGFVENEKLPYLYNVADVTVSPSLWEAYPVVPMESLACKTPLITTNVGAISEITNHFEGGYKIVPMHDSNAITNALNEVISGKISKSDINRENGKKYHSWDSIIQNTISVYSKLQGEYYG